jgi:hypothetical protein
MGQAFYREPGRRRRRRRWKRSSMCIPICASSFRTFLQSWRTKDTRSAISYSICINLDQVQFWTRECPEAIADGRVMLQGHDFFVPQPTQALPVAVFLLRTVLHDWNMPAARNILRALAAGATPHTQVVIVDHVVPYKSKQAAALEIPYDSANDSPAPLLSSVGFESVFDMDMIVRVFFCEKLHLTTCVVGDGPTQRS